MPELNEVANEMSRLAAAVQSEHSELDGTFATLPELEALVRSARKGWNDELLRRFGAYYGETLRKVADPPAFWVDFDTAVSATPTIAKLGRGPDLEAILRAEGRHVFPLAKVKKFLDHGDEDSLTAFAPVALTMLRPPKKRPRRPVDPDDLDPAGVQRIDAFLASPSVESAKRLGGCVSVLRRTEIAWVLAHRDVRSEIFFGLFGERATGRGYAKFDVGLTAAKWLWRAIDAGAVEEQTTLAECRARLGDKNKLVRQHAVWVLARTSFKRHDEAFIERTYAEGDSAIRLGILRALESHVNDAVMDDDSYPSVTPHAALILAAVTGPAAARKSVARTLQQIAGRVRVSIADVLPAVALLLERGKPAEVEDALQALTGHVFSIKHGRAEWSAGLDDCIPLAVGHTRTDGEKGRATKTRIAASYAMRALTKLGDELPARHRDAIAAAMSSVLGVH